MVVVRASYRSRCDRYPDAMLAPWWGKLASHTAALCQVAPNLWACLVMRTGDALRSIKTISAGMMVMPPSDVWACATQSTCQADMTRKCGCVTVPLWCKNAAAVLPGRVWLCHRADPGQMVPAGLDPKVVAVYHGVGQLLSRFTTGKIPKAFKVPICCCSPTLLCQALPGSHRSVYLQWELVLPLCVSDPGKPSAPCARSRMVLRICTLKGAEAGFCSGPASLSISCDGMPRHVNSFALQIIPSLRNWEEVLFLTDVPSWTPHAVFQATRLFVSSLNAKLVRPTTASTARRHSSEM